MGDVLVTGGTGFIGSHLVEALIRRQQGVAVLARPTSRTEPLRSLGATLVAGDVADARSLRGAVAGRSVVYHLAGLTRSLRSADLFRVNEQGVGHVAQACAEQASPPVLVVLSSLAAAGPSPPDRLRVETDPAQPVSDYGRSKRGGELAAERFADRVPVTVVRPPIVFGERDRLSMPMFWSIDRLRIHLIPGRAARRYSILHAQDLAEMLIAAAERGARLCPPGSLESTQARGYYFAACDEHPTWRELGELIREVAGHRRMFTWAFAMPVFRAIAATSEGIGHIRRRPAVVGIDKAREVAAGSWACSPRRAADELGFSVTAPLADRIRQTLEWYRRSRWMAGAPSP